jgi:hypothetical protein
MSQIATARSNPFVSAAFVTTRISGGSLTFSPYLSDIGGYRSKEQVF